MKKISVQVIKNIVDFIKRNDYYNKIQVTFNQGDGSFQTETFYYWEGKWGHSIFKINKGQETPEIIQDTQMLGDDSKIMQRLGALESDAEVVIAANSPDYVLSVKI